MASGKAMIQDMLYRDLSNRAPLRLLGVLPRVQVNLAPLKPSFMSLCSNIQLLKPAHVL